MVTPMTLEDMEDDGPWYLGKAKEEYTRRRGQQDNDNIKPKEDEDPIQVRFLF
jgi:SEL1 protein